MRLVRWFRTVLREELSPIQRQLQAIEERNERDKVDHERRLEELSRFTTELYADMRRYQDRKDRELDRRLHEMRERHEEWLAEQREQRKEQCKRTDEMLADHREFREEQRAAREALLRMIDRLGPAPGAGAA